MLDLNEDQNTKLDEELAIVEEESKNVK